LQRERNKKKEKRGGLFMKKNEGKKGQSSLIETKTPPLKGRQWGRLQRQEQVMKEEKKTGN